MRVRTHVRCCVIRIQSRKSSRVSFKLGVGRSFVGFLKIMGEFSEWRWMQFLVYVCVVVAFFCVLNKCGMKWNVNGYVDVLAFSGWKCVGNVVFEKIILYSPGVNMIFLTIQTGAYFKELYLVWFFPIVLRTRHQLFFDDSKCEFPIYFIFWHVFALCILFASVIWDIFIFDWQYQK